MKNISILSIALLSFSSCSVLQKGHNIQLDEASLCDRYIGFDLSPKFPAVLRGVLEVKSLSLSSHFVHGPSLHEFHRCLVS